MLEGNSHRKNKRIIAWMLFIFSMGLILFLIGGCSAMKLDKSTSKSTDLEKTNSSSTENKNTKQFDFSIFRQENFRLSYLPINPFKELRIATDNKGNTILENAYPVYESSSRQENKNIEIEETEVKTNEAQEERIGTQEDTNKRKLKVSIPWYAYLLFGFFAFATLIGFYLIYRLTKNITAFSKQLNKFEL